MASASLIPDPFLSIIVIILVVTVVVLVVRSVNTGKRLQKLTQAFINERHKVSEIVRHLNDGGRGMRGSGSRGSGMPDRARDDRDDDAFFAPVGGENGRDQRRPMQEVQHIRQVGPGAPGAQTRPATRAGAGAGMQNGGVRPIAGASGAAGGTFGGAREPYRNAYHEERERRNNKRGFGRRNKPVIPFGADRTNEPRMSRMAATIIDETPALSMDLSEPAQILRQREAEAMRQEGRVERRPMPGDPSMMKDPMRPSMAREGVRGDMREARGDVREVREVREAREDVRADARASDQSRFMDGGMQQNARAEQRGDMRQMPLNRQDGEPRRRSQESAYEQTMRQFGGDRRVADGRRGSVQRRSFNGGQQRQPRPQQRDAARNQQARQMQGQAQQAQAQPQQRVQQAQDQVQPQQREMPRDQQRPVQPQQRDVRVEPQQPGQQRQPVQQVQREQAQVQQVQREQAQEQQVQREQVQPQQQREQRRVVEDPRVAQEKAAVSAAWIAEEERRAEERRARAAAEAKRAQRQRDRGN